MSNVEGEARIIKLKHLRTGKKSGITKRITRINQLINDNGSRTKIKFLMTVLYECYRALNDDCEELFQLMESPDNEWLEDVKASIDECAGDVSEYLSAHQDDSTSSGKSFTDSWVRKHAPNVDGKEANVPALSSHLEETQLAEVETSQLGTGGTPSYSLFGLPSHSGIDVTVTRPSDWDAQHASGVWSNSAYWKGYFSATERRFDPYDSSWKQKPSNVENLYSGTWGPQISERDVAHRAEYNGYSWNPPISVSPGYLGAFNAAPGGYPRGSAQPAVTSVFSNTHGIPSFGPLPTKDGASNEVDSWIDELDERKSNIPAADADNLANNVTMAWFVQQTLPRSKIPVFDGAPSGWVPFITKFYNLVHKQVYLTDAQRHMYLLDHLVGEPKTSVKCFSDTWKGYVSALRSLKFTFAQRNLIAEATLAAVIHGKSVSDDETAGLTDFYYTVRECLVTLKQLNYVSDLHSSDTLRQTSQRLPVYMQRKWAEHSRRIRRPGVEINLVHFEAWLHQRVMDRKESCWPGQKQKKTPPNPPGSGSSKLTASTTVSKRQNDTNTCPLCKGSHYLGKCEKYIVMNDEVKLATVQSLKLCFNCIKGGHMIAQCTSKTGCREANCGKRHHTSLHKLPNLPPTKPDEKPVEAPLVPAKVNDANNVANDANANVVVSSLLRSPPKQVILLVVPVLLHSPEGGSILTFAFLDNGSQGSFLRDDMAERLGVKGEPGTMDLTTIKDEPEKIPVTDIENLVVSSQDGSYQRTIEEVSVVSAERFKLPGRKRIATLTDPDLYTHLDGINIDAIDPNDVTMLIGGNVPEAVLALDIRHGGEGQPLAVKTVFGWTLYGPSCGSLMSSKPPTDVHLLLTSRTPAPLPQVDSVVAGMWRDEREPCENPSIVSPNGHSDDDVLHRLVERMWIQEVRPVAPGGDVAPSREDSKASAKLDDESVLVDGHYQVPMLWKNENMKLPDNIGLARKRFEFLRTKLRNDPVLYEKYKETFARYVSKGYARRLTKTEASQTSNRTWYLPHFPVCRPDKAKIRVVKDAAVVYKGHGLNTSLITGPDLLHTLPGVLNRFRKGRYAIVADVEEMFHQVRVCPEDADSLRFLWTDNIHSDETYPMQMLVHIFGAKSSPTCANYALQRTARENLQHFNPLTAETVLKSFYMDDLLKSVDSLDVACKLSNDLISILKRGGFRLTKFMSNSPEVLASLPASEVSQKAFLNIGDEHLQQALGVTWEISSDTITFTFTFPDGPNSKRGILKITASLFDPLGLVAPFLLKPKLLLRELWRKNVGWDEEIDENLLLIWTRWKEMAKFLSEIKVKRCFNIHDSPVTEIQLHIFADASELAYGPVAYLRFSYKDNTHACSLVMSKSRIAPIKPISLPRLELNAAVTAVRLFRSTIFDIDLPVERVVFWSDSTLVLQYINNTTHRFKTFVANRVTEILDLSSSDQWNHVPGVLNPADLLSRGVDDPRTLMEKDKYGTSWLGATEFLSKDEEEWPETKVTPLDKSDPEIKRRPVLVALGLTKQPEPEPEDEQPSNSKQHVVVDPERRFSSWTRLTRTVGWVRRYLHNKFAEPEDQRRGELTSEEIESAEDRIVGLVQSDIFKSEISILDRKGVLPTKHKLSPLSPYIDERGVLRVGGRLRNARIPAAARNQMILPKDHPVTRLLITHNHRKNGHVGREHVLANLREKYWILNGRVAVRTLLRRCLLCKIKRARRMYPFMANLPSGRLACEEPPFTNCGVDLFGPIYIKQGRKQLKRWGVIFTCLTVRCVHLEPVESLETDDFINCLRRFVNRRGSPKTMYSDRGTNFTGITSELKDAINSLDHHKIAEFATTRQFTWRFNPPGAPHMGGAWERLVKSSKEVLTSLMKEQPKALTDQQLHTLLTEVERILNSRPLTHVSDDVNDFEALTPNHILLGLHRQWSFICDIDDHDLTSRRKYRYVQALALQFWKRWRREYLPKLTTRSRWRQHVANLKVGQLVLLVDDENNRKTWSLARITQVFPGSDNTVRTVEVKTKDGVYTRPAAKVCSLEDDFDESPQGGENVAADSS